MKLTPWLAEPGDSLPQSEGFSNDPIAVRINVIPRIATYFFKNHSNIVFHLRLDLSKGIFPVGVSVKILKDPLLSSILTTWPAHLNHLDSIALTY